MAKRRGHRGNGREMFATGGDEPSEEIERPEDSIIVVDGEGNPIDDGDGAPLEFTEPADDHEIDPQPDPEDDPLAALQVSHQRLQQQHQQTTAELERERRQREALTEDNHNTTKALIGSALETAKGGLKAAKAKYADAASRGDWDGAADAQADIAVFTQEIGQLDAASREIETSPRQQPRQSQQQQLPQDFNAAVDRYISGLTPKQQEFARKHRTQLFPENDDKPLKKLMALANAAVAMDHELDSPEFFQYLETNMKFTPVQEQTRVTQRPVQNSPKRPPIASAPVARGNRSATTQVELTAAEREMAKRMGMSPARYALQKKRATDGAKDPEYRGPRYSKDDPAIVGNR